MTEGQQTEETTQNYQALNENDGGENEDTNFNCSTIFSHLLAIFKSIFNPFSRFPILKWLPKYQLSYIQRDLIAGFTVGLTLIPQSLAYSAQAGLPPYYGLYTSFVSPLVYAIMGGAKDITNGPTAIMSSLVAQFTEKPENASLDLSLNPQYEYGSSPTQAILLAFFVGITLLTVAILQLGWLANFISHSIIFAFIQASSLTIPIGQIKKITGQPGIPSETFEAVYKIFTSLDLINWTDFIMGVTSLIALYLLKMLKDKCNNFSSSNGSNSNYLKMTGWFVGSIRNAIIVAATSLIAFIWKMDSFQPIDSPNFQNLTITGEIPAGLPKIGAPSFSETYYDTAGQKITLGFSSLFTGISTGIIICALMSYLESYAIARSFARNEKYLLDGEQEMYAIGASCFATSFAQGFPVTGSFSRSSINNQCEVATPLSGLVTSLMIILSLQFLTDLFYWIPTSSLGAVIILAASAMFKWDEFKHALTKGPYLDRILFVVTFLLCLYETAMGIVIGAALSILSVVVSSAFPKYQIENMNEGDHDHDDVNCQKIIFEESTLFYPSVGKITKLLNDFQNQKLLIDCQHVKKIDNSVAIALIDLVKSHEESLLVYARSDVRKVLLANGLSIDRISENL